MCDPPPLDRDNIQLALFRLTCGFCDVGCAVPAFPTSHVTMCDPPFLGRDNFQLALLRDLKVTEAELSRVRAGIRRQYDLPGLPTDVRATRTGFHTHMDAAHAADEAGEILQFVIWPSREV